MDEAQTKIEEAVCAFLIYQRANMLAIIAPLLKQKEALYRSEDKEFHVEINSQFETLIRREIAEYIATNMNFKADDVYLIVESLNVPEFIGEFIPESGNV